MRDVLAKTPEELEEDSGIAGALHGRIPRGRKRRARQSWNMRWDPALRGDGVIIGHGRHRISDLLEDVFPCTRIGLEGINYESELSHAYVPMRACLERTSSMFAPPFGRGLMS